MTVRRRWSVAVAVGLVVLGATGIGTLATGGGGGDDEAVTDRPSTIAELAPTTSRVATTTTVTTPSVSRPTAPAASVTTIPVTAPTTAPAAPTTTIVPIVTYAADIGVLAPVAVAAPVRVTLPVLETGGVVVPTGVDDLGELAIPADARTLVWYRFGPTPGAPGSAVIAGHLNWRGVDGIFSDLARMPIGASFTVDYDDGTQRTFVVRSVELVDKPAIGVNGVFARDGESVLRLVTCGGEFDDSTRHYRSNVIVTAIPA